LYRPVAILCALSMVLETVDKEDLEAFMKAKDILPTWQHGFKEGAVRFEVSAAFNNVGMEDLQPKMLAMGIGGKALRWFRCYLTDAKQHVELESQVSDVVDVEYGVRQGSLLGPVLYLLHVSDHPFTIESRETDGDSGYANDTAVWVVADDLEEAHRELELVNVMVNYTKVKGPALNGAKTQVMVGGKAKSKDVKAFTINVDSTEVKPLNTFDLLGITFDKRSFTVRPYLHSLAREARFRAGRVARLAQHLPRGQLLRQLGSGCLWAR
jgi:hypothetical protein